VAFKGGRRDNRIYAFIAVFIVILIIFTVIWYLIASPLNAAYIGNNHLGDAWSEDISERESGSHLFGLEKWASFTYRNNDSKFPAYVTLTSYKLIFLMNKDQLKDQTIETINKASDEGIIIDENSKIEGVRTLSNGHTTMYIIYEGSNSKGEQIKLIGQTWICVISGTSIICIGFAQLTNNTESNIAAWTKIIRDKTKIFGTGDFQGDDGLLFNVKCH
jgi:hypothetical protein